MKKHITVLVSNDLVYDQRVRKVCNSLIKLGFEITLIGRKLKNTPPLERPYPCKRFKLIFAKGAMFYALFNVRLFFYLLCTRTDIILANDLDTLLPAFLISKLRKKKLVYDSHEYFTEASGLTGRPFPKKIWTAIEGYIFPKLKSVYTVNRSIASIYEEQYGVAVNVVRNVPPKSEVCKKSRAALDLPDDQKIMLLQGAFIDYDRGCVEAVEAMQFVEGALLLIIGEGQAIPDAKLRVVALHLQKKVKFLPKLPFESLKCYTAVADLGLSLDKPNHLNYKLSLPNKLFDYIQSETPVLLSPLPELKKVLEEFEIGMFIDSHEPEKIARAMEEALYHSRRNVWQEQLKLAARVFIWEKEEEILHDIFATLQP